MSIAIIDYGMGNLGSVVRAFEECGADVILTDDPLCLKESTGIVLPGVGAFTKGMRNLHERGWVEAIHSAVHEDKKPLLGICLGMQLLASMGFEGGETPGLGFIPGRVVRLTPSDSQERIPHIGWNEVVFNDSNALMTNIRSGTDFYFVHSYHFACDDEKNIVAKTPFCGNFSAIVQRENVFGVQFHPEKSQKPGFKLIKNFLRLC